MTTEVLAPPPAFNAVIVATEAGVAHLPPPQMPYYALFGDGLLLHRKTELGNALLPMKTIPDTIPDSGVAGGRFTFTAEVIPAAICAQAVDFFRRVYTKFKTEAEVLITRNYRTGEYRLFIPHQRVNGSAVNSIYEPTNIQKGWMVVGTMHSHCMFSAFHSGTDTADAADMDGVHFTIGMVLHNPPEIVGMVSMNKVNFHYKAPAWMGETVDGVYSPPFLADFTDLSAGTAPEWWDTLVYPSGTPANLDESKFPSLGQGDFDKFLGIHRTTHKPMGFTTPTSVPQLHSGFRPHPNPATPRIHPDADGWFDVSEDDLTEAEIEYLRFNGYLVSSSDTTPRWIGRGPAEATKDTLGSRAEFYAALLRGEDPTAPVHSAFNQDDDLPDGLVDLMVDSGCLNDSDWANDTSDLDEWEDNFKTKLQGAADVLRALGLTVSIKVKDTRNKPLPGQLEAFSSEDPPTSEKGQEKA